MRLPLETILYILQMRRRDAFLARCARFDRVFCSLPRRDVQHLNGWTDWCDVSLNDRLVHRVQIWDEGDGDYSCKYRFPCARCRAQPDLSFFCSEIAVTTDTCLPEGERHEVQMSMYNAHSMETVGRRMLSGPCFAHVVDLAYFDDCRRGGRFRLGVPIT
jgi:hypothetical protein